MRFVTFILGELGAEPLGLSSQTTGYRTRWDGRSSKGCKLSGLYVLLGRLVNLIHCPEVGTSRLRKHQCFNIILNQFMSSSLDNLG